MSAPLLAQLITSKLSHELAGVLGAIKNGAELLETGKPETKGECIKVVLEAATAAVSRLRFLRELYGYNPAHEIYGLDKLRVIAEDFFQQQGVKVRLEPTPDAAWSTAGRIKLLLGLMVLAKAHIHPAKEITIHFPNGKAVVEATGGRCKLTSNSGLADADYDNEGKLSVFNVDACYAAKIARELGLKVCTALGPDRISYEVSERPPNCQQLSEAREL